jgi:aminoglycoside phosphotransferase (APT) family kinase protein
MLAQALALGAVAPTAVRSMTLVAGGNSRETWIAVVTIAGAERQVVFRCDPDHWIRPESMCNEINGLRMAERADIPAPRVLFSSSEIDIGRPYVVTTFVEGTAIARRIMKEPGYAPAREDFARQCGEILAKLHNSLPLATGLVPYDPLEELERYMADSEIASPVLQGAIRWLAMNRPPALSRLSPVHRDFRIGNLMMRETGVAAVLDWETCQLGEAEEDLAWLCSRSWRYGSKLPVGGLGTMKDLVDAYERCGERPIDMVRFHWWSVYAETRWGLAGTVRQRPGSAGDMMEQAAVARRACRQEHNVLLELKRFVAT